MTINAPLNFAGGTTVNVAAGAGTLSFLGSDTFSGSAPLTVANHSSSGGTAVTAGVLAIAGASALPKGQMLTIGPPLGTGERTTTDSQLIATAPDVLPSSAVNVSSADSMGQPLASCAVPEPGTLMIVGIALGMLIIRYRGLGNY